MKKSQNEQIRIDGFTKKEVDAIIRKKERSMESLSSRIEELRSIIHSEQYMLRMWRDFRKKFDKKSNCRKG